MVGSSPPRRKSQVAAQRILLRETGQEAQQNGATAVCSAAKRCRGNGPCGPFRARGPCAPRVAYRLAERTAAPAAPAATTVQPGPSDATLAPARKPQKQPRATARVEVDIPTVRPSPKTPAAPPR